MTWNRKQLRKGAWNTVFKRGLMAWMAMVAVCFIFSYLGVDDSSQTKFVKGIDQVLGQETEHEADNVTILKEYVKNMPMIEHNSYLYGRLDEDLKQYILIHIALNISKFKI